MLLELISPFLPSAYAGPLNREASVSVPTQSSCRSEMHPLIPLSLFTFSDT